MDLLSLEDFTLETINYLMENEVEENIHLDYKDGKALQTNDKGKNDITKDVSSFAGSVSLSVSEASSLKPVDLR